uniref:Deuterosome assembly protein 1 n=1 Tax=Sphenodon punctatus TaxID=8508 RepID=A0A8D0HJE5_SPHPU
MENRAHFLSTPYEPSLHELIDIMAKKKLEWERKMEALETRMAIRDQELANAQNKLDQRGQEVLNRDPLLLIKKKTQTFHLWSYYEKLQWHQVKQDRVHSKKKSTENQETPFELSNLNQKLEEFKAKSREWDKQETLCQNQLVSLDAQRKLLSEKCNLFQRQTQNYQIQISSKKEKQEEGSSCSQAKVEHLRVQPDISNETPDRDEVFIEKLKLTVHEIALSKNKLQKQNLELQKELKVYQRQCQNKEAEFSEMRNELQSRNDLLEVAELECQQLRKELLKTGDYKNMQEIQIKYRAYLPKILHSEDRCKELIQDAYHPLFFGTYLLQIRDHLYREEQSHSSEQERMRTEISDLTEELHQKEITIATIMEKATLLERQLKMELQIKENVLAKQQLSEMRYHVVKSENAYLKRMMENLESRRHTTIDLSNKEHESYTVSIHMLECENERLQNDPVKLQGDTEAPVLTNLDMYEAAKHTSQPQISMQEKEERYIFSSAAATPPPPPPPFLARPPLSSPFHLAPSRHIPLSLPARPCPTTATEKFLQEEEKRAMEFEKILNSHIEELQRHSENTLKKYTNLRQS